MAIEKFPIGRGATLRELQADPHPLLARLRTAEPVSWLAVRGGWLVTRYDFAVRVLRDPTTFTVDDPRFSTSRVVGASMLSLDGADHTRHREPFAHPFRPAGVQDRFAGFVEAEADRLISAMRPAGSAELRREFAGPLAVAVVTEALGLRDVNVDTVLSWYASIVAAVSEVTAGRPVTAAGADAFARLRAAVTRTLGSTDGPSLLREAARAPDGLSQDEVASNAAVLMFGGIDTTEGMILNAVRHLLGDTGTLPLVRDHADLLPTRSRSRSGWNRPPQSSTVTRHAMSSWGAAGFGAAIWSAYRSPAPTEIRPCSATPTGSTSGVLTPNSTLPSRRVHIFAWAHSSPGPKPRSRSVDSWTACLGCGSTPTTPTRREVSCSANPRRSRCAGLCSSRDALTSRSAYGAPPRRPLVARSRRPALRLQHPKEMSGSSLGGPLSRAVGAPGRTVTRSPVPAQSISSPQPCSRRLRNRPPRRTFRHNAASITGARLRTPSPLALRRSS